MTEIESLLILNAISGLGNIRIKKLLDHFGSAEKILSLNSKELTGPGIVPRSAIEHIIQFDKDDYLKKECGLIKKYRVRLIAYRDEEYPQALKEIPDCPVLLYVKGALTQENKLAVAIVGSRRASFYGISMAEKIALGLCELGITIVSGMARGIDTAAHRGALRAKGATIAVLGNGLAQVYPPENKKLFDEIVQEGAVVSEFAMETPPSAYNFPRRNRIISGLSLGVVVVEASQKSGALITSRFALEQGREVFAVPGKIDNPNARGVHNLIQKGAKLIGSIEDIIEELQPQLEHYLKENKKSVKQAPSVAAEPRDLSDDETAIYKYVDDHAVHVDDLARHSGFSAPRALHILLRLEIKKLVRQLPGKLFVRNG